MAAVQSLKSFAIRWPTLIKAIDRDVSESVSFVALAVGSDIVDATPVDTGKARSNWVARVGSPTAVVRRPYAPIPSRWRPPYAQGPGRGETANAAAAKAQHRAAFSRLTPGKDHDLYISNVLPYIDRLNSGWSRQASSGFIARAITSGTSRGIREFRWQHLRRVSSG